MTDVGKGAAKGVGKAAGSAGSAAGGAAGRATGAARDAAGSAGSTARDTASAAGSTLGLGAGFDRLKDEAMNYLGARAQKALSNFTGQLGGLTEQLTGGDSGGRDDGQNGGQGDGGGGGGMLLEGGKRMLEGQSPLRAFAGAGGKSIKDKVTGAVKKVGGGGGMRSGGPKVINIVEDIDVGVPVREAYNQWTQYKEFGNFTKGVQSVDKADDVTTSWKGKIWWSNRSWQGKVTEQIPDQRIVWTSDGEKGTNKGVVTFHPLGDNLTKVLLVVEYYPKGFFEKTANIWRAQGRRLRLDLKHYRRFIMMRGEATDAWRGEIREGEVVRDHDEVVEEEERQAAEDSGGEGEPEEEREGEPVDEEEAAEEEEPAEEPEDEYEEEPAEGEEEAPEDEYAEEGEPAEDEYEEEPAEEEPAEEAEEEEPAPAEDEYEEAEPAEEEPAEEEPERTRG